MAPTPVLWAVVVGLVCAAVATAQQPPPPPAPPPPPSPQQRVLQSAISSLVFQRGAWTTYHRASGPRPQLECLGDCPAPNLLPETVLCENKGSDGRTINWACRTETMPKGREFGALKVSCEGWDAPTDAYVLAGSCALQYRLTLAGPSPTPPAPAPMPTAPAAPQGASEGGGGWIVTAILVVLGVALAIGIIVLCVHLLLSRTSSADREPLLARPPPYAPQQQDSPAPPQVAVRPSQPAPSQPPTVLVLDTYQHDRHHHHHHHHHDPRPQHVIADTTAYRPSSWWWPTTPAAAAASKKKHGSSDKRHHAEGYATTDNV